MERGGSRQVWRGPLSHWIRPLLQEVTTSQGPFQKQFVGLQKAFSTMQSLWYWVQPNCTAHTFLIKRRGRKKIKSVPIEVNIYWIVETVIPPTKMWLIRACSVAQYSQRQELLCRLVLRTDHQPPSLECSCAAHTPGVGGFGSASCLLLYCLSPTLPRHHKQHKCNQTSKYCHFLGWDFEAFDLEFSSFSP